MKRFISVCFLVLCCASWCLAQNEDEPSWKLLTNSLGLRAGDQIVIAVADDLAGATTQRVMGVNNKSDKVNGVQSKGFLSKEVDFNLSDSTIEINEDVMVLVLEEDSIPGIYMLRYADTDDEYMCATKDAQCRLEKKIKEDLTLEDNTLFDVWIDESGCAQIAGYGVNVKNQILFSPPSDKKKMKCSIVMPRVTIIKI